MRWMLAGALRDLVLPAACVGCDRPGLPLCDACVTAEPPRVNPICGVAVRAAAPYDGAIRAALIAYKEHDRRDLAPRLGALVAGAAAGEATAAPILVPVPSTRAAARRRGGDHVLRLAHAAARIVGARVARPVRLTRCVRDSAGLGASERFANLDGAMTAARPPRPQSAVCLVDDIVTSGATIAEAIRALTTSGWLVTGAAVVAATPRRSTAAPLAAPTRSG